jgi:DNA-binding NarL/FixJ family response regulator
VTTEPVFVTVIHPEPLAAEGILVALARYPGLVAAGRGSTATEGLRLGARADVAIIHDAVMGAAACMRRLRARGVRVLVIGDASTGDAWQRVSSEASIEQLASLLVPSSIHPRSRVLSLTARERQVLSLASEGLAGKQIARRLNISPKTVERHKTRIYAKLGVPNQAAAVGFAGPDLFDDGER